MTSPDPSSKALAYEAWSHSRQKIFNARTPRSIDRLLDDPVFYACKRPVVHAIPVNSTCARSASFCNLGHWVNRKPQVDPGHVPQALRLFK